MSIAGGVDQAVLRGKRLRCETIQIFVKSNVQWKMLPLRDGELKRFFSLRQKSGIKPVFAHSSYLINLASADRNVRRRSISSLRAELHRSAKLRLPFIVLHPGSHGGRGEKDGLEKIVDGLDEVLSATAGSKVKILLETTAGQGNSLGHRFEHLARIMEAVEQSVQLGVCFDTCHVFAAGYDIRTEGGYEAVMEEFDQIIGLKKLKAFHVNDCKGGLGSRLDRHEHIGKGRLGLGVFKRILNDTRFRGLPMVLETPKGRKMIDDRRNLYILAHLG